MDDKDIIFEESLSEEWRGDFNVVEVPLKHAPFVALGAVAVVAALVVAGRVMLLEWQGKDGYVARAQENSNHTETIPAPRGLIRDRFGKIIAENRAAFRVSLDLGEFVKSSDLQARTLEALQSILGIPPEDVWARIDEAGADQPANEVLITNSITSEELVRLKGLSLPSLALGEGFEREYPNGPAFGSVVGYVGLVSKDDLARSPLLTSQDVVGRGGLESFYDSLLRGSPGSVSTPRDAQGRPVGDEKKTAWAIGASLTTTLDGEFQKYFHDRLSEGLLMLGRTSGAGIAIDPRNGEVLAIMSFPDFDNNILTSAGNKDERLALLANPEHPLFDRAVAGLYTPGSTIKPLVGVAALADGVIDPQREIFSPGYLDIPNPYDPENPTRYKDWRYQGNVNLASALAQSSNVYFYEVGGGAEGIKGLGVTRLKNWWERFRLGLTTGIDLVGEQKGFLPTPDWKQATTHRPWLLGDTYNVAIGQGDLLLTPIQLLSYIASIANGGKIYKPVLNRENSHSTVLADLTSLLPQIQEVQKGMRKTVTAPLGTAYKLNDLGFSIGAKTGSSQVENNAQENAFFVGYAPFENPQVAILILVEHSKEGSLNAVPIAKDVLQWYYEHRIRK